jgi:hypothetical protein
MSIVNTSNCFETAPVAAAPAPPTACLCCGVKSAVSNGTTCSKRCDWMCVQCCPQCGRGRMPNYTFCSGLCAGEARHANWCVYCGVRQLEYGHTTCQGANCIQQHQYMASQQQQQQQQQPLSPLRGAPASYAHHHHHNHHHGGGGGGGARNNSRHAVPHEMLSPGDKVRRTAEAHVAQSVECVYAVVKVGGPAATRKRYLAYRGHAEDDLAANVGRGAPKYGHGGEGNEQRRFVPLQLCCPGAAAGSVDACADPSCEACCVLTNGMTLSALNRPTHFATSTAAAAVSLCTPAWIDGTQIAAVAVCRAVVGQPALVADSADVSPTAPAAPYHSLIVTDGDTRNDSTFLYRDDAVDVQFIIYYTPRFAQ